MIDRLDKTDIPVAAAATAFPIWAQWLPILLQIGLGALGFIYLLMRMYREHLLIKWAQRRIENDRDLD